MNEEQSVEQDTYEDQATGEVLDQAIFKARSKENITRTGEIERNTPNSSIKKKINELTIPPCTNFQQAWETERNPRTERQRRHERARHYQRRQRHTYQQTLRQRQQIDERRIEQITITKQGDSHAGTFQISHTVIRNYQSRFPFNNEPPL